MKTLFAILIFSVSVFAQDWVTATIDSNGTTSSVITLGYLHPIAVTVDTPWTTANLNVQVYDAKIGAYRTLKGDDGNAIVLTITSPPATYRFKPIDAWAISDKFKLVSTSTQTKKRTLKIKRGKLE